MNVKLLDLLIKEVSGVDDPANEIPGWMVAKNRATKSGRVISGANLKLVMAAMDALRALVEAAGNDDAIDAARCVGAYGVIADYAKLPLVEMARQGDLPAAHYLRALVDDDTLFEKVIVRAHRPRLGSGSVAEPIHPLVAARGVAAQLFRT